MSSSEKRIPVAILGAGGYSGGELLRILVAHPLVEVAIASSRSQAGKPIGETHPNLDGFDVKFSDASAAAAAEKCRVVFLALNHGDSIAAVREIAGTKSAATVIDLSGDFRLPDPAVFEKAYGRKHDFIEHAKEFVYSCPETLKKGELAGARWISNPGCFATGALLALAPLARLLRGTVVVNGVTGASGSGTSPSAGTHFPLRDGNFKAYKVLSHQHEPEIAQAVARLAASGSAGRGVVAPAFDLVFTVHSAPITRGIYTTATVEVGEKVDALGLFRTFYSGSRFVRVREKPVELKGLAGTNKVEIGVASRAKHVVVTTAIDNLGKGAAGQAVQSMNLALGLDESAGLTFTGLYP